MTNLVFAATTYNNGLFPKMENLVSDMKALTVQNKKVAVIENGTWAPSAVKTMKAIRAASLEELCQAVPRNTAEAVWRHYHEGGENG